MDFGEGCGGWVLHYAAHAVLVGIEGVAEFPEGVALEVKAWWVCFVSWDEGDGVWLEGDGDRDGRMGGRLWAAYRQENVCAMVGGGLSTCTRLSELGRAVLMAL